MSPDVPDLLASGLLDRDWVGAQLGTVFASDEDAAARCLEPEADCSPHPLYEPTWSGALAAPAGGRGPDRGRAPRRRPAPARPAGVVGRPRAGGLPRPGARGGPRDHVGPAARCGPRGGRAAGGDRRRPGGPATYEAAAQRAARPTCRCPSPATSPWSPWSWPSATTGRGCAPSWTRSRPSRTAGGSWSSSTTARPTTRPRCWPASPRSSRAWCRCRCRGAAWRGRATRPSARARGKYVAFVDPDHTWHPDFLAVMLGHLEADGAPMAHAAMRMPRRDGDVVPGRRRRPRPPARARARRPGRVRRPARGGDRGRRVRRDARRGRVPGPAGQAGRDGADAARVPGAARPRGGRAGRRPPLDRDGPGAPPRRLDDRAAPAPRGAAGQHRAAHDGRPRPHGALGDPDDVPASRECRPRAGRGGRPAAEGRRAPPRDAARDVPERASARAARPDRSGRLHQPRDRGDQRGGGGARAYLGQPAARRVPRPDVGPVRPRRRHRPAAGGRPAGADRQCRRGVRAGPHPPRAVPGRSSGGRRPGPRLAGGTRPAVARGGGPGLGAGPPARLRRLDRRRAARGRARCPDGRARWWRDSRRAPVAAGAQGRSAAAARHRLRRRPRPPGAVAGVAARIRGGLGPRRASRSSVAAGRTAPSRRAPTTSRWTSRP